MTVSSMGFRVTRVDSTTQALQKLTGCNPQSLRERLQGTEGHVDPALLDTPYDSGVNLPSLGEIGLTPPALSAEVPHIIRQRFKQLPARLLLRHLLRIRDYHPNAREYTIRHTATRPFALATQDHGDLVVPASLRLPDCRRIVKEHGWSLGARPGAPSRHFELTRTVGSVTRRPKQQDALDRFRLAHLPARDPRAAAMRSDPTTQQRPPTTLLLRIAFMGMPTCSPRCDARTACARFATGIGPSSPPTAWLRTLRTPTDSTLSSQPLTTDREAGRDTAGADPEKKMCCL